MVSGSSAWEPKESTRSAKKRRKTGSEQPWTSAPKVPTSMSAQSRPSAKRKRSRSAAGGVGFLLSLAPAPAEEAGLALGGCSVSKGAAGGGGGEGGAAAPPADVLDVSLLRRPAGAAAGSGVGCSAASGWCPARKPGDWWAGEGRWKASSSGRAHSSPASACGAPRTTTRALISSGSLLDIDREPGRDRGREELSSPLPPPRQSGWRRAKQRMRGGRGLD
jgi:hypothetical protein